MNYPCDNCTFKKVETDFLNAKYLFGTMKEVCANCNKIKKYNEVNGEN